MINWRNAHFFSNVSVGKRLAEGRFTLVRSLGCGGMGCVWLAQDEVRNRQVALKITPGVSRNSSRFRALKREAAYGARLNHANIAKVEGLIVAGGREPPLLLMEYVAGISLTEALYRERPMAWAGSDAGVKYYMLQLCDALEYVHDQKIIHRDLRPSNLLINHKAELKLIDFGLSTPIASDDYISDGWAVGTPPYMSPQQIKNHQPRTADDIYSLGVTFYELLTSTLPFRLDRSWIKKNIEHARVQPMGERLKELGLVNDIPDYVEATVMACLEKVPNKRPVSVAAIRKRIEAKD